MLSLVMLVAAQRVPGSQAPPPMDLTALYALIGAAAVGIFGNLILNSVRWFGARVVEREDKDKDELRAQIKELRLKFEEIEESLAELEKLLTALTTEGRQQNAEVGATRLVVEEIKTQVERRFEKQAESYQAQMRDTVDTIADKISNMEFQLRKDAAQAMHDATVMAKQESGVHNLRDIKHPRKK